MRSPLKYKHLFSLALHSATHLNEEKKKRQICWPCQPACPLEALYILSSNNCSSKLPWFSHQRPVWLMLVSIIPCTFIASGKKLHSRARDRRRHGNLRLKMYRETESPLRSLSALIAESVRCGRLTSLVSLHDSLTKLLLCVSVTATLSPLSGGSVSSQAQAAHTIRTLLSRSQCVPLHFTNRQNSNQSDRLGLFYDPLKLRQRSEILW